MTRLAFFQPRGGSSLNGDDKATAPHQLSHRAHLAIFTAVEHQAALRAHVHDARTLFGAASFTLLRAAVENAAVAVWLLAPKPRPERVMRSLQLRWQELGYQESVATENGLVPKRPFADRRDELRKQAIRLTRNQGLNGRMMKPPPINEIIASVDTELGTTPQTLAVWRICSGLAHGQVWATMSALDKEVSRSADPGVANVRVTASWGVVHWAAMTAGNLTAEAIRRYETRAHRPPPVA